MEVQPVKNKFLLHPSSFILLPRGNYCWWILGCVILYFAGLLLSGEQKAQNQVTVVTEVYS